MSRQRSGTSYTLSCPKYPTEPTDRIERAMANLFPDCNVEVRDQIAKGTGSDLETFREAVFKQRIIDTVRTVLEKSIKGDELRFSIGKQAAYMGKVNIDSEPHPLGEIEVRITAEDPEELIRWIAPPTLNGEIVDR